MRPEKERLMLGTLFGFSKSLLSGFSVIMLPIYFSAMNISILTYAVLLSIGDLLSFFVKPVIGYLTDKYGEKAFLIFGLLVFSASTFLIGQTTSVLTITLLQMIAGISGAFLLSLIIIFSLRHVRYNPDRKVSFFNGISGLGWVFGLLLPGLIADNFGVRTVFNIFLLVGLFLAFLAIIFSKDYKIKSAELPSLGFVRKVPTPLLFKTIDMVVFNGFVIFFVRHALVTLGMSRTMVSILIAFECGVFAISELIVGRFSDEKKRKHWIPIGMALHCVAIYFMLTSTILTHYFLGAGLIGLGGAFIDIWVFSYISEKVKLSEKGKVIGTVSWSYDIGTVLGAQVPAVFIKAVINPFASLFIFPVIGFFAYILMMKSTLMTTESKS